MPDNNGGFASELIIICNHNHAASLHAVDARATQCAHPRAKSFVRRSWPLLTCRCEHADMFVTCYVTHVTQSSEHEDKPYIRINQFSKRLHSSRFHFGGGARGIRKTVCKQKDARRRRSEQRALMFGPPFANNPNVGMEVNYVSKKFHKSVSQVTGAVSRLGARSLGRR